MEQPGRSEEWRDRLLRAVAYRMHYQNPQIATGDAALRIRDFMKYGDSSVYKVEVLAAAGELFMPMLTAFAPMIRALVSGAIQMVDREISNGEEIESGLLPTEES